MSEIEEVEKPVPARHLSGGDAVVTIALLIFIVGWVGGWIWALLTYPPEKEITFGISIVLLLIIAGPAVWAGGLIAHIIGKKD